MSDLTEFHLRRAVFECPARLRAPLWALVQDMLAVCSCLRRASCAVSADASELFTDSIHVASRAVFDGERVPMEELMIEAANHLTASLAAPGFPQLSFVRRLADPAEMRAATPGGHLAGPGPLPAATVGQRKERNQTAIRLLGAWLHEDAEVESDTWDLLKSDLDRDRLSGRRLWT